MLTDDVSQMLRLTTFYAFFRAYEHLNNATREMSHHVDMKHLNTSTNIYLINDAKHFNLELDAKTCLL